MKKLNLCIDIDGTLTDPYYWIPMANEYFQKNTRPEDVTSYDIHEVLGIPREEYMEFYKMHGKEIHRHAAIRDEVKKVLDLFHQHHRIYYVTAREHVMEEVTKEWIEKHQLPCDELFLLGSHYKVGKAEQLHCDVFLEDNYDNAIQLAGAGFEVILLDTYYNRHPLPSGVTRVKDWIEIKQIIEQIMLEQTA